MNLIEKVQLRRLINRANKLVDLVERQTLKSMIKEEILKDKIKGHRDG